jgi:biotin synthase
MKVCSGGIVGMGEGEQDRVGLLIQLSNMTVHPESVPINMVVRGEGTPLASLDEEKLGEFDAFDFIRTIAVARILMPVSHVRLSAGREKMNEQMQAMAFMAGANSIFYGEKLLTTANPEANQDMQLFKRLGIEPEPYSAVETRRNTGAEIFQPSPSIRPAAAPLFYDAAL